MAAPDPFLSYRYLRALNPAPSRISTAFSSFVPVSRITIGTSMSICVSTSLGAREPTSVPDGNGCLRAAAN